jgi:hypothetical protein
MRLVYGESSLEECKGNFSVAHEVCGARRKGTSRFSPFSVVWIERTGEGEVIAGNEPKR